MVGCSFHRLLEALVLNTLCDAHLGPQQLLLWKTTDMPPLICVLNGVSEGTSHMDEVCHGSEKNAKLGESLKALWVYHISGNMSKT